MARDFTGGSSDRVDVGTFSVVSSAFTMCCWIYIDSFDSGRDDRFISKSDGALDSNHDWMLGKTDSSGAKLRARFNRSEFTLVAATILTTGVWHHALVTYNSGTVTIFLNGASDGSSSSFNTGNLPNNTSAVYIGNQPTSTSNAPDGRIAEVGIWSVVLTANEIAMLARRVPPSRVRPVSLEGYWRLGVGSTEPDWSGKGRNGTLTGTAIAGHAPVQPPYGFDEGWRGAFTAAGGGGFQAAWARNANVMIGGAPNA